jgi:hypothetical protein
MDTTVLGSGTVVPRLARRRSCIARGRGRDAGQHLAGAYGDQMYTFSPTAPCSEVAPPRIVGA